nr:Ig-like domain repeat protein [uncultured Methanobrevibacter sp.]
MSEAGGEFEKIIVNDTQNEKTDQKVVKASSSSNEVLADSPKPFHYGDESFADLDDAVSTAMSNGGGTIYVEDGVYLTDGDDCYFGISGGHKLIIKPYNPGEVRFQSLNHDDWLFEISGSGTHVIFEDIVFHNGYAEFDGGAIEVISGKLTLTRCTLDRNYADRCGGAISVQNGGSLIAEYCLFVDNSAKNDGGAISCEQSGSVTLNYCTFKNNKVGNNENNFGYEDGSATPGTWSFTDCLFEGHASLKIDMNALTKSVKITPDIGDDDEDVDLVVLYKDGSYYDHKAWNSHIYEVEFSNLEKGTYTVYMMKGSEKRYSYPGNTFTIKEPNFVLDDTHVFETLSAAVNAITGESGEITVEGGEYTGSANFNVNLTNKIVIIYPKTGSILPVIFSSDSQNYLFSVGSGAQLIMHDINITGKFNDAALKFDAASEGEISDCEFNNIKNSQNQPGTPIYAENSKLVLKTNKLLDGGCTFTSNGPIIFKNTVATIEDCTFEYNLGSQGGAINADSTTDLTVTDSEFFNNTASESGGAIYASKLKVNDTEFIGNDAKLGGAIYITSQSDSIINITRCVFDLNNASVNYRNIYSESRTRNINLQHNEYDLYLEIYLKDNAYGSENILDGVFDWGSNLNNTYTVLTGLADGEDLFGDLLTVVDNKFKIELGVLSSGTHELIMAGMDTQQDSNDHFYLDDYYYDLYGNEFYLYKEAIAKTLIEKANITLNLVVNNVLIPETPVLNVYANWDLNYTIFIGTKFYQLQVVNGKGSMQLTGLDLGNHTVVAMHNADENFNLAMNFTTFTISKTYSNFLVISTNVEYDTLNEAVSNSNDEDVIYVKNGTYKDTGIMIFNKTLDIIALDGAVFDAQGSDANFIIVDKNSEVYIYGITFKGLRNRNTNYGAIVNHGALNVESCNFTDNRITKTSFAENGGAAIFSDGDSLDIDECNFINNAAPLKVSTAAVTSVGYEDVTITSSNFTNNTAREGGALHFKNISQFMPTIISCEFEQNVAVKGSAIYVGNNSRYLSVSLSSFTNNDIKNTLGEKNQLEGGVIYVNANTTEVTLDIDSSYFESNSNSNVNGGVICLDGSSSAYIDTCTFNNNKGETGSVILIKNPYSKKLTLIIGSSTFTNNNATTGAIATSPKVTALLDECLFLNNTGQNRNIYSNGFTVAHDCVFDVKDVKLNALTVEYGEYSIINGIADIGVNIYAAANLTVANENVTVEIKNNAFTYNAGILNHGKYYAVLNGISDTSNNTYLMDSITKIFRVHNVGFNLNVSVDNITYGETIKVIENLPANARGTVDYQLNGKYYTKEELESLLLDAGKYTLVAYYDYEDYTPTSSLINFEVYKANPTITVADVKQGNDGSIIVKIETNVPSIYTIEIEDYKLITYINASKTINVDKTYKPNTYTINITSQERVNYKQYSIEEILNVNSEDVDLTLKYNNITAGEDLVITPSFDKNNVKGDIIYVVGSNTITLPATESYVLSGLDEGNYTVVAVYMGSTNYNSCKYIGAVNVKKKDSLLGASDILGQSLMTSLSINANNLKLNSNDELLTFAGDDIIGDEFDDLFDEENYRFIYQEDEDDDYSYFETLEEAIDEAVFNEAGIITVRGGTYDVSGIDIEGEVELTIRAYENEEVIFDCGNEDYFLHLTYDTEVEIIETAPPIPIVYTTEGPTITLENLTIRNGYNDEGGAIELVAGTLTMTNCNFYNNKADDLGGAICIGSRTADQDATVNAVNCTFIGNTAGDEGGAIYIMSNLEQDSSASFLLCTFLDNYQGVAEGEERMMNYFAGDGTEEDIVSRYCVFNGNGEIYDFTIDKINQTVSVKAKSTDPFDSVVLLYFNTLPLYKISNSSEDINVTFEDVISGNYTFGVMDDHYFNSYIFGDTFEIKMPNFIIFGDEDYEVYENLTDAIDVVDENGIIYANFNYYDEENLELEITKSFTLKNFRDRMVVFDGNSTHWFFKVAEGCNVVFDGINFVDGGINEHAPIENYGDLTFKNCNFTDFETDTIIYNNGVLNISTSEFSDNILINTIVQNERKLSIDTVAFRSNIITSYSIVYNNGVADITGSNFIENINYGNGGAIYNIASLNIENTVFSDNEGVNGGAVYSSGTLYVVNSTFEDNTANGYGGAIYNDNTLNIFNSTFTGGFSERDGGAIYNNKEMNADNSTFVANTATGYGGAIYNNNTLTVKESLFGINFAEEYANIYNGGTIQFTNNAFDFYDVILDVPDGQYGIPTIITGTLDPQFNMDLELTLVGFVNNTDAPVTIQDGIFEYNTGVLPKGAYNVILNEVIYDNYGNIYYGEAITDRLIIYKANVQINLTVDDIVLKDATHAEPVLKINASQDGLVHILFNNKFSNVTITGGYAEIPLDSVDEEGNYTVMVVREGNENYNDAVNTTIFKVTDYEGNFIVNSTGRKFDTLREAIESIENSATEDIIYIREGTYSVQGDIGIGIGSKKLTIIGIGDVVFDANSTNFWFLNIMYDADITLENIVIRGFKNRALNNTGNLTIKECVFINNTLNDGPNVGIIHNHDTGNLTIVDCEFYDNKIYHSYIINSESDIILNGSRFENNTIDSWGRLINITDANSAKVISTDFVENTLGAGEAISVDRCNDVLINAEFYDNDKGYAIFARNNSNLNIENSIFIGNTFSRIIESRNNVQNSISGGTFTNNTVNYVILSEDKNLSVSESSFLSNTISGESALSIGADVNASVIGCVFAENKGGDYRNIYSKNPNVNITNTSFDAVNVDFTVSEINYGENETINGTIDIGTNLKFTVELEIGGKTYSLNVTDNKFTYNTGRIDGGDHNVVLNGKGGNSNTYIFDKITKVLTVNRIDPGLNVTIHDITQGENLTVIVKFLNKVGQVVYILNGKTYTLEELEKLELTEEEKKNITRKDSERALIVSYELNGIKYSKSQLENLTLTHGDYVITATFNGDKNYLPASQNIGVKVNKLTPKITVSNASAKFNEEIKINVTVDVANEYTVFIDNDENESVTLYVKDNATFTLPSEKFKPGIHEIKVYVFESDDYTEAYAYANLTVDKAAGIFNLSNNTIVYGENATVSVEIPTSAYGNITYTVYDDKGLVVYTITQSCQKDLVVPDLKAGAYIVAGTFEGDDYYTEDSTINPNIITVNSKGVDLSVIVSNITYGENATVTVNANVDGEYIVTLGNKTYPVTVSNGSGNVSIPDLTVGNYVVITIANITNYFALNETEFGVTPKAISIIVYADSIAYGDNATVWVYSEVDGQYNVRIYEQNYTANVVGGKGNATIPNLGIDENILVSVTIKDGNYSAFNTTMFNVFTKLIPATISVGNITYGENATVTVKADFDANYTVTIWDENYTVSVINGTGVKSIPNLAAGKNILASVYYKDAEYGASNYTIFNIHPKQAPVRISIENITYGENATVIIEADVDGNYTVTIRGINYTVSVSEGKGNKTIPNLSAGSQIEATVKRDDNYTGFNSTTFSVIKSKTDVDIELGNVTGSAAPITLRLPADAGGNVSLYVNGILTQTVNVVNGSANITVTNLKYGSNNVTVVYSGDDNYGPINKSVVMNRNTTIIASDMTRGYNSGLDYTATILDDNGTAVANTTVSIKVGTTTYTVKTDANGVLNFNNKLAVGNYGVAIVNPVTGEYKLTNLKIVGRITGNKDVKIYFADGTPYKVRIVGDDGNYVGAGEIVKMNVGGKTYTVKTDKNGYATLKLSLKVKTHTITVTYKGFTTKNKVTVKSVVKPVKKTVKVKKTAKRLKIKVKLKGKKVLKNKRVYMKITVKASKKGTAKSKVSKKMVKAKIYKAKTNKKGIATFKVPKKVIKKLKKGKKYQAIFTYKAKANGKTIKNTAKCYIQVR